MTTTWILTANASEAHLYESEKAKLINGNPSLRARKDFSHPQSREKRDGLLSDRCGNYHGRKMGHGSMVEKSEPKVMEAEQFARELANDLLAGRQQNCYQDLIIIAPASFQGKLKKHLQNKIGNIEPLCVAKDYTRTTEVELLKCLAHYL